MIFTLLACVEPDPDPKWPDTAEPTVTRDTADSGTDTDTGGETGDSDTGADTGDTADSGDTADTADTAVDTGDTGDTADTADTGDTAVDPSPIGTIPADFALPDLNPNSPRYGETISPRDYLTRVSGYYFIHST